MAKVSKKKAKPSKKKTTKKKAAKAAPSKPKIVYLSFSAEIDVKTVEQLLAFCSNKVNEGYDEIHIGLSTPGGSVRDGVNAYHVLRALPIKIIMYNTGGVDSIGNAIFLAGDKRYAGRGTTFMFHGVGFDIGPGTSVRLEEKTLQDRLDSIRADNVKIAGIISSRTRIKAKEAANLFREQATKDTAYAHKNGFIDAVKGFSVPKGLQIFQLVFNR
jgi:ATP-dependent protease ClpP protease subunit